MIHSRELFPSSPMCWYLQKRVYMFRALLQWSWFEAVFSTISFMCAILFYTFHEEIQRERRGSFSRALRLTYSVSNWAHALFYLLGVYILKHVIDPPSIPTTISNNTFIAELIQGDGIPWDGLGVLYVCAEVVVGIILYDAVFFLIHMCLHYPTIWHIHRSRHTHAVVRATSVLNHSLVDAVLQVTTNVVFQRYNYLSVLLPAYQCAMPKTRLARLFHNMLVTWMLTEGHANLEAGSPGTLFKRFPRMLPGLIRHREHHRRPGRYFQQFGGYLDDFRDPPKDSTGVKYTPKDT
jgi:hypothetical protein